MKLIIENFGAIKNSIEIEPSDLTIFCGVNNTGKTYAMYVLNALMDSRFQNTSVSLKENLYQFFSANHELIDAARIEVIDKLDCISGRTLLLPAERTGINLFFRELNSHRANLLRGMTSGLLKDVTISRYPQPIHDYIEFMNAQPEIKRRDFSDFKDIADRLQKEILQVQYKIDSSGDIQISPENSEKNVGLHLGSSTTKTFFGLWSYLTYLAQAGDCLMIDEPELNLHPRNQCAIAHLLAELVNRGIRVVVSTHSDYMVRQWSNLIMLGSDFTGRDELAQQYNLPKNQWLTPNQVAAYEFDSYGAQRMEVNAETGIRTPLFDESITRINAAAQDIYFARQESAATPKD